MTAIKYPLMAQCVEIVSNQLTRSGQADQLRFIAETQGRDFAEIVKTKVVAAGKARKK